MSLTGFHFTADSAASRTLERGFAWLRFEPALEAEYRETRARNAGPRIRLTLLFAVCTMLGFVALDHRLFGIPWRLPDDLLRFGIELPLLLLGIWLVGAPRYQRFYLPVLQVAAPLFSVAAAITAAWAPDPAFVALGTARLVLITFFVYFMLGMPFFAALRSNTLMVAAFAITTWWLEIPAVLATYNVFILLCANVFAGYGSYALEHAMRLAFLERKLLAEVASHDGLTGLLNRAAFDAQVSRVWDQAVREQQSVAVVMLDIDHFKSFNDRYGHQAGDRALREVAAAVARTARRPLDLVARFGGEELIAILPGADRIHAETVARAWVEAVFELNIPHAGSATAERVTISVGAAAVDATRETSYEAAVRLADRALYLSKDYGRNRYVMLDRLLPVHDLAQPLRVA
ncbi:MAG: diguanylate cyclase [Steroidobacteraceae bacterium]|nr:GGDEF domain-containing protein [Nevskiaceae bacterium]MCP5466826.1 GGDEF domain-containing protein [Nevskiaceae bacterium]MCP5470915.1 GGDEF domain-containing protein [Nevskiaceae bacterium]